MSNVLSVPHILSIAMQAMQQQIASAPLGPVAGVADLDADLEAGLADNDHFADLEADLAEAETAEASAVLHEEAAEAGFATEQSPMIPERPAHVSLCQDNR